MKSEYCFTPKYIYSMLCNMFEFAHEQIYKKCRNIGWVLGEWVKSKRKLTRKLVQSSSKKNGYLLSDYLIINTIFVLEL